jgi:aquaporin Z
MNDTLKKHWPEYLIEASGLAFFMMSACAFGALLEHPASPAHQAIPDDLARRMLMGVAMGLTSIGIVYSPWGRRSGAHLNPAMTLTFLRLGKIEWRDAVFYVCAQFAGGITGVLVARGAIEEFVSHPKVNYVATLPGERGLAVAFMAEAVISFILMFVVLNVSNNMKLARFTGLLAGALVATYISVEAPLSGMSLNPARTFGSAFSAQAWMGLWIYFTAPPLGMLLASELYIRLKGKREVYCAKLHHDHTARCIFRCRYSEMSARIQPHNARLANQQIS